MKTKQREEGQWGSERKDRDGWIRGMQLEKWNGRSMPGEKCDRQDQRDMKKTYLKTGNCRLGKRRSGDGDVC